MGDTACGVCRPLDCEGRPVELTNEFDVAAPIEQAWRVLTDLERIAPCLPGAELTEVEGDEYRGVVKVKVGPAVAQYKGTAVFVERYFKHVHAFLEFTAACPTFDLVYLHHGRRTKWLKKVELVCGFG